MKRIVALILPLFLIIPSFTILAKTDSLETHDLENGAFLIENPQKDQIVEEDPKVSIHDNSCFIEASGPIFSFNETASSFIQKIAADTFEIQGTIEFNNGQISDLSHYYKSHQLSRFEVVDIAYNNNLISQDEKISSYCSILENKKTENVTCLHPVLTSLVNYAISSDKNNVLYNRINTLVPTQTAASLADASLASTFSSVNEAISWYKDSGSEYSIYSSEHFVIHYVTNPQNPPNGYIALTEEIVSEMALYFEFIRSEYISMGYNVPLLWNGETKYPILIDSRYNSYPPAVTTPIAATTTTQQITLLQILNFTSFNNDFKETFAHEFFHAIQGAYMWSASNSWFDEATANWGAIQTSGLSNYCETDINSYLASTESIYSDAGYGAVLFPLTIQSACGVNAIKAIWEEYAEQTTNDLTFEEFKTDVIDEALDQYYNSFDGIFLRMARYNFAPSYFYANYHPGGATAVSSWTPRITDEVTPVVESRRPYYSTVVSNATVGCYSSNYYNLVPDETGKTSQLMVSVTVSGAGGRASFSCKTTNGTYQVGTMTASGTNTYTYTTESFGNIQEFCVIVSNVNADDGDSTTNESITYSITYHVNRGTSETVSIGSSHRYWEDISTLSKGEYKDYLITLSSGSQQLIQTFGAADTYLYVYDSNGNLLNNTSSCDDAGYGSNALVSMSFSSGVQYRVRVCFYSSSKTGNVRLSIIPTATYANFEAITTKTDNTSIVSTTLSGNASNVLAYKFTSPNEYVVNVSANADVYLYIIDPTSTAAAVSADNTNTDNTTGEDSLYNDDYNGTNQSQITKIFYANVTYLVIVAAYNPSTGGGTQYYLRFS